VGEVGDVFADADKVKALLERLSGLYS